VSLAADADVFLCEAAFLDQPDLPQDLHLSALQAAMYAARAGAGQLVLTHLVAWNDPAASLAEARGAYGGELTLAFSGKVIDFPAGTSR
jgi:ribonuclease BN (tRNA processing enzyme)